MTAANPRRLSYVLRFWEADTDGKTVWRIVLVDPTTSAHWHFTTLPGLVAFLEARLADSANRASVENKDPPLPDEPPRPES